MGLLCIFLLGASPYTQTGIRASPLCGDQIILAQKGSNSTASRGNCKKNKKDGGRGIYEMQHEGDRL